MTLNEAKKVARLLQVTGHHGIEVVTPFPNEDGSYVRSLNRCWVQRTYRTFQEAQEDTQPERRR